jgi:hypothetical protein
VARDLGLSENRRWIVGLEEVYERAADTGMPRLHCFFDRRIAPGYIAWIADDGRSVHVGVGGYAAKFQPQGGRFVRASSRLCRWPARNWWNDAADEFRSVACSKTSSARAGYCWAMPREPYRR